MIARRVVLSLLLLVGGMIQARPLHKEEPRCDLSKAQRLKIHAGALAHLQENRWELVQTGIYAGLINPPGDTVAGNPNTLYTMAIFNDSDHHLTPADYPATEKFEIKGGKPPTTHFGSVVGHNEAIVLLLCMPPPAKYVGITAYVTGRIMTNDTDGSLYTHAPMVEITNPFNYINLNTTAGTAEERLRRQDVPSFFGSVGLMVFTSSVKAFHDISQAYVQAGLDPWAINFYPISAQEVRLHDRSRDFLYDFPDLISVVGRISYFEDQEMGENWARQKHPVYFLRSPSDSAYFNSVPEPLVINDISGDSEQFLQPTIDLLIHAIVEKKIASGTAKLLRQEQLVSVPNDKNVRIQCLNNVSYIAAVDPVMTVGGCGFGTRDCRYGTSAALDLPFGEDLFFVVVGVKHEAMEHASYASLMLTSETGYEQRDHTITFRETDGAGTPELYLPHVPDAHLLYSVTVARHCPAEEPSCIAYTTSQFQPHDIVYWMERAYLQWSTGAAPSSEEYIMSHVLTFQGSL